MTSHTTKTVILKKSCLTSTEVKSSYYGFLSQMENLNFFKKKENSTYIDFHRLNKSTLNWGLTVFKAQ